MQCAARGARAQQSFIIEVRTVISKFAISVFGAMILALAAVGIASAQTEDKSLRHVNSFELLIEQLDDDSATCGITEGKLIKAVKSAASGAPFNFKGNAYTLYVRVSTLPEGNKCFSSIDMQAYYYGELVLPNYPKGNFAEVVLWENGTIFVSQRSRHGGDVTDTVEQLVDDLVQSWHGDNS